MVSSNHGSAIDHHVFPRIQRAWRASQTRRGSWPDPDQTPTPTGLYQDQDLGTLKTPGMSSEDFSLVGPPETSLSLMPLLTSWFWLVYSVWQVSPQMGGRTDEPDEDREEGETGEGCLLPRRLGRARGEGAGVGWRGAQVWN